MFSFFFGEGTQKKIFYPDLKSTCFIIWRITEWYSFYLETKYTVMVQSKHITIVIIRIKGLQSKNQPTNLWNEEEKSPKKFMEWNEPFIFLFLGKEPEIISNSKRFNRKSGMKFPFDMRCELNSYKTQFAKVKRGKSEIILRCPQKKKSIGIYVIFISFNSALRLKVCLPGLGFFSVILHNFTSKWRRKTNFRFLFSSFCWITELSQS